MSECAPQERADHNVQCIAFWDWPIQASAEPEAGGQSMEMGELPHTAEAAAVLMVDRRLTRFHTVSHFLA